MEKKNSLNLFLNTKKMLKGIIVFVCCFFAWVSFAEAEHLDVASEERIQKSTSMPWRDFDLRDVGEFLFQTPTIVDKRNGRTLRSLTEIRWFLYNNFSTKELRADAEREVLEKNNITAALFLGLSAKYILSVTEKDCVMRFLKENLDRLEPHAEADVSQKERFSELERLVRIQISPHGDRPRKVWSLSSDELKTMEKEVLDSTDDKLKFAYLESRIVHLMKSAVPDERLSKEEYSMAMELGGSPEISRDAYLSLRAGAEITFHGFSAPAALFLSYNAEMGAQDSLAHHYALKTAQALGNLEDLGYHSYLDCVGCLCELTQCRLVNVLYGLLAFQKDDEAICLLGFLDSIPQKCSEYFDGFKWLEPLLLKRTVLMPKSAYDAEFLRGKERYARGLVYESEHYESRFRKSMLSSFRLEKLFVRCFPAWGRLADAEHLDVAREECIKEGTSIAWRNFDLRDVPESEHSSFQNPTIVDKRNGRVLRSLTEVRWFLYNNFSTKELRADAEREVLEKNNITAALFLELSARYIFSMTEKDQVMRFLKENADRLEPHAAADLSQKEKFRNLQLLLAGYFSSAVGKWMNPLEIRIGKILTLSPDELKGMKKEVLGSADDTLKFAYLSARIQHLENTMPRERLSEEEYSMAVELESSPKISREAYLSLRSAVEIKFHGVSMPAVILLNYNIEAGCDYLIACAANTASSLRYVEDIGYYAYLAYRQRPNHRELVPDSLICVLAQLLMSEKDEEAIRLLGFLDAFSKKPLVNFPMFKQLAPSLSQRKSKMTKRAYDAAYLRGKEQYDRDHIYENEDHESRFRKSILSIFRLENLPVDSEKSLTEKPSSK